MSRGKQEKRDTYITKIYGCSVDLAQFDENSPLYSMCRSWIQNKPLQNAERNHTGEDAKAKAPRDEGGNLRDLRIPSPVPQPSAKFFMASVSLATPSETRMPVAVHGKTARRHYINRCM
ncbi:hypothetical protein HPB48_014439 [Haemaphysalis longicornis]|uniref:Uncharacterized protein n=1 Tax=Haemaphysalis longicornis TaxID=44386 RepID=A0A9J6H0L8_HAELO|nr:hypothetical protein HPB48_014439 [Haemaphysalis longicornis]